MDIDEFLDREIAELGLQMPIDETPEKSAEAAPAKEKEEKEQEKFDPKQLSESIRASIKKGDLEQAEQDFGKLWEVLKQQKLQWDKELYEDLLTLTKHFSSFLSFSYDDAKRKIGQVYELIHRAKISLIEGKKDVAFKLYSQIVALDQSIPGVFFEEKKVSYDQIMDFYRELKNATDNDLLTRVATIISEINQLIENIKNSIKAKEQRDLSLDYSRLMELYSQIPEGFVRYKNTIGLKILEIYKNLSISTEIYKLQKHLSKDTLQQHPQVGQTTPTSQAKPIEMDAARKSELFKSKIESAKQNIEKGFYNEASKDIEEAIKLEPKNAEARAIHAKIKTLQ